MKAIKYTSIFIITIFLLIYFIGQEDVMDSEEINLGEYTFQIPKEFGKEQGAGGLSSLLSGERRIEALNFEAMLPDISPVLEGGRTAELMPGLGDQIYISVADLPIRNRGNFISENLQNGRLELIESTTSLGFKTDHYTFLSILNGEPSPGDREIYSVNDSNYLFITCENDKAKNIEDSSCRMEGPFKAIGYSASFSKVHIKNFLEIHQKIEAVLDSFLK